MIASLSVIAIHHRSQRNLAMTYFNQAFGLPATPLICIPLSAQCGMPGAYRGLFYCANSPLVMIGAKLIDSTEALIRPEHRLGLGPLYSAKASS